MTTKDVKLNEIKRSITIVDLIIPEMRDLLVVAFLSAEVKFV